MVEHPEYPLTLGATCLGKRTCRFLVWAPRVKSLELRLLGPTERVLSMQPRNRGYYELTVEGVTPGARYFLRIDGRRDRPDPASRFQPDGVHAASEILDLQFNWTDQHWCGIPLHEYITYELHVGAFTPAGTFDAAIAYLDDLKELGITAQNHDQVGNRLLGERLSEPLSFEQLKLAAAVVILSPFQPLLFMGEEYGETAPFPYFVSHTDPELVEAVRRGRKEEFSQFRWQQEPPDPQDEATFQQCKLDHNLKRDGSHRVLRAFYKRLIELRNAEPSLAFPSRDRIEVTIPESARAMAVRRWAASAEVFAVFHFGADTTTATVRLPCGKWTKAVDSADEQWNGPGSSLAHYVESVGEVDVRLPPYCVVAYHGRRLTELSS